MTTKTLGDRGEDLTGDYLLAHGCTLLDRRWRCRYGELDLVARDAGGTVCFVEVKLRRNDDIMTARESVTLSKQRKLRAAALLYLQAHPTQLQPRFDVAEIYAPQGTATRHPHINYLENAF